MARHSRDQAVDFKASPARLASPAGDPPRGFLTTIAVGFERFALARRQGRRGRISARDRNHAVDRWPDAWRKTGRTPPGGDSTLPMAAGTWC